MRFAACAAALCGLLLALPAGAATPIKIGAIFSSAGPSAPQTAEELNGMHVALDEFHGKIADRPVELLVEDAQDKPNTGLENARKLIFSDHVDVLTGIITSNVALAVAPFAAANKVPLVITNAGADALSGAECSPWVFRVSFSDAQLTSQVGPWMMQHGMKRLFIMGADFVAPHEQIDAMKKSYLAAGGKIVGEIYTPFGQTQDFAPYFAQVKAAKPDAVFAVYYGSEAILFAKQYDSFGLKDHIALASSMGLAPQMMRKAQGDAAAGVIGTLNYVPELDTPENKAFQKEYQAKYHSIASEFAVMGYDGMRFILTAEKSLGGHPASSAALAAAIGKVSYAGPRGPTRIDPRTNNIIQNIYIADTVKQDGKVVFRVLDTLPAVAVPPDGCHMTALPPP